MNPRERYQQLLEAPDMLADSVQARAVETLQTVYERLISRRKWYKRFLPKKNITGVYLWGEVGSGKTCLMNLFFECVPGNKKMRMHFHEFMQHVHRLLKHYDGKQQPLTHIGKTLANKFDVVCLDELHVDDISDATILLGLFKALFSQGVMLLTTSNIIPDNLYKNGLQRSRFLPAIALIKENMLVCQVDNDIDYRVTGDVQGKHYFYPLNDETKKQMLQCFHHYAIDKGDHGVWLTIAGRKVETIRVSGQVVWFAFNELCRVPRCHRDYTALSERYKTVLVSQLTQDELQRINTLRNFIHFVDVMYDRGANVVISADVSLETLIVHPKLAKQFERTRSRLMELR